MAIILIRHGETPGNRDRIIQFPDTPLSDRGREQAARVGARMASEPIREIWVSDHARAHQTAQAVEETTGAALSIVEDLAERNLGELRGRPYSELGFDPFAPGYVPPAGESWEVFHDRVDAVWARIEDHWHANYTAAGDHLCIVTHGLVLRSLFERRLVGAEGLAERANADGGVSIANTAVSIVEPARAADGGLRHRIELLACVEHLDGDTAPRANPNVGM